MPELVCLSENDPRENAGCAGWVAGTCVVSLVPGVIMTWVNWPAAGAFPGEALVFGLGFLVYGVVGSVYSAVRVPVLMKFGRSSASASKMPLVRGAEFNFVFRQEFQRFARVERVGVFLVYRETVRYPNGDGETEANFERLIDSYSEPGVIRQAGDALEIQSRFAIPDRPMGMASPDLLRKGAEFKSAMWVVKVRLDLSNGSDVWRTYELVISEADPPPSSPPAPGDRFDVYLLKPAFFMHRPIRALGRWVPHLVNPGLLFHGQMPVLLREHLTEAEARVAEAELTAAGLKVEVRASPRIYWPE